jgi:VCBS repeat-containing protein
MFHGDYQQNEVEQYTLVSPYNLVANVSGEHDGDVLGDDTDADSDSLTVTAYRTGASEGSGTAAGSMGSALTGTYGQLTLNANGSYTYAANQSAADDLDAGDVVTDSFNYTVSDGTSTDTATIVITVIGINDAPAAVNDTDSVDANETTTATNGSSNDVLTDDTDVDDHDSLSVTAIQPSGGSSSSVSTGSSYNSSGTEVTGTYGTLTIGADGSYTYVADQDAADNIDAGSSETDVFTYTYWDGAATDTGTITITVSGEGATTIEIKETKKEKKRS